MDGKRKGHSHNGEFGFRLYLNVDVGVVIDTESHAPTSPATGDTEYITYTVQRGDTLWAISNKYGCTVAEIVALNGELITDPDLIFAGWELKLPQE